MSGRSGPFGAPNYVTVARALADIRSGRPVLVSAGAETGAIPAVHRMRHAQLAAARPYVWGARALADIRSGRPVLVTAGAETAAILPVDGMADAQLAAFRTLCAPAEPYLLVTARRARSLGLEGGAPIELCLPRAA